MATFGDYTLPLVRGWTRVKPQIFVETPLPSKDIADRQVLGGIGLIVEVSGVLEATSLSALGQKMKELEDYSDGQERALDLGLGTFFDALMLRPEFEKTSPLIAHYRVRFVQTSKEVIVIKKFEDLEANITSVVTIEAPTLSKIVTITTVLEVTVT